MQGLAEPATGTTSLAAAKSFSCRCGKPVFFRNSQCLACKAPLGYEPELGKISALEPAGTPGLWRLAAAGSGAQYRRCANLATASGCNWLVRLENGADPGTLCLSCRLDRTIPDLSIAGNAESFRRISIAQRRLVALLASLKLPLASKVAEDPARGLAFDLLRSPEGGPPVMTGHSDGIVTLNIDEADDAHRERVRDEMHEQYRTLLGHLRHETGHYYWDRLISGSRWIEDFRKLFGDEQQDYPAALQSYYQNGPPPEWRERFVSAYASSHPWEDWAETWAHYLHITDTFSTALSFGIDPDATIEVETVPFGEDALFDGGDPDASEFLRFINSWIRLTAPLNELSRGMGVADFYPFVLSRSAVTKLHFIHMVVSRSANAAG